MREATFLYFPMYSIDGAVPIYLICRKKKFTRNVERRDGLVFRKRLIDAQLWGTYRCAEVKRYIFASLRNYCAAQPVYPVYKRAVLCVILQDTRRAPVVIEGWSTP